MTATKRTLCGLVLALSIAQAGCYGNSATPFPPGLEPWEEVNRAELPAPVGDDLCPETLVFSRGNYVDEESGRNLRSVHARACIHAPIETVFAAARDPQTGRDPTQTQGFRVVEYETEPEYDFSYQTHVVTNTTLGFTPEFDLNWRHGVVAESEGQMQITASRWQKTFGHDAIRTLEGSLLLMPLDGDGAITEVDYQYHLDAEASGHSTIEAYLTVIFGRLRDRAHDVALVPDDCVDCATPPDGY